MSAKLLQALTDENPDLQKQIGCMTGIFQLFDRHHNLTGKRLSGHGHKRSSSGHSHLNNTNIGVEVITGSPQTIAEKSLSKNLIENQRISFESSRASFSSSCSSSLSSLDCNKTAQPEPPSFERPTLESPSKILQKSKNSDIEARPNSAYPQLGKESLDLRDVVKDSIYRESRGLSVRTSSREESTHHVLKHRDSPRPLQLSKSVDGSYTVGINRKPKMPIDLNESLRVLAKLKEAPWYFNDVREPPRPSYETKDGSLYSVSKDAPRFSFDSRDASKSTTKLRELPRLSLDSREGSIRSSDFGLKSNPALKDLRSNFDQQNSNTTNLRQESGTYKRPPSVVAKLMGLEAMPNMSSDQDQMGWRKPCSDDDCDISYSEKNSNRFLRLSKMANENKQDRSSRSPKSSFREPISPRLRSPDPVMKPIASSKLPLETAPWRQQDRGQSPQKTALKSHETRTRPPTSRSVYCEIEKRLKELEFQQSNKDIRALKQILGAMQQKGLLETKKEDEEAANIPVQKKYNNQNLTGLDHNMRSANRRYVPQINRPVSPSIKGTSPSRAFESPIVIMKPAKLVKKSGIPAASVIPLDGLSGLRNFQGGDSFASRGASVDNQIAKDKTPKINLRDPGARILGPIDKKTNDKAEENSSQKSWTRSMQAQSRPQSSMKENTGCSTRSSGSSSPRLLQKKPDLEKRSRPPIPSSDSSKPRRQQSVRQQTELGSPGGRRRPKLVHVQQNDDQLSEISSETRNLSQQGDEISIISDSNISLASQVDIEVTSADRSEEMNCVFSEQGSQSPLHKATNDMASCIKKKKSLSSSSEDGLSTELTVTAPEQPSPVSVLDASFDRDDLLPSPVKKISNDFKDDETGISEDLSIEDGWKMVGSECLSNSSQPSCSSEINHKKLENIELLVQKLRRLNSAHDEATTDHIASLCEDANPDHRYVSEILLASGLLLKDLGSSQTPIQLYPSGYPINPDLFLVLEQTKASLLLKADPSCENTHRSKSDKEKLHRKLIFDTVNEFLVQKLALAGPHPEPWLGAKKLTGATPSGQRLLRDLCSELDHLQAAKSLGGSLDEDDDGWKSIVRVDVGSRGESWTDFCREVSGMVLDIERLIFKDLVDEVVNGEAYTCLRAKPNRRRRQLFAK